MSLVFTAICPHPPILIPSVGKENLDKIKETKEAMEELERKLYPTNPDTIIVITPHGEVQSDAFIINLNNEFEVNFEGFGDFSTKITLPGDTELISKGKEDLSKVAEINIISDKTLDHGTGIPLFYLTPHLKNTKILPISFSLLNGQTHLEFGKALKEIIMDSDRRIAVIAAGDLSHCLSKESPAPFHPAGKDFDKKIIKLLEKGDSQKIANMDAELIEKASECGWRSILILLGILNNVNYQTELLSYEAPFGVGYLVANLEIK
jgi:MEMO1 family protein